jgi:hypothetical protein
MAASRASLSTAPTKSGISPSLPFKHAAGACLLTHREKHL